MFDFQKSRLAVAVGSALLGSPLLLCASTGPQIADGVHLEVPEGDYSSNENSQSVLSAINRGTLTGSDVTLVSSGSGAAGVLVEEESSSTLERVAIVTSGDGSAGASARGLEATIHINNGRIETTGNAAAGLEVQGFIGTRIVMNGGSIHTVGDSSAGATAFWGGGWVELDGVEIRTEGNHANGVEAMHASVFSASGAVVKNSRITTTGDGSAGFHISAAAMGSIADSAVETHGDSAHGIHVDRSYPVQSTNVDIVTYGQGAIGAFVDRNQTVLALEGGSIAAHGLRAAGATANDGASLSLDHVGVQVFGDDAHGVAAFLGAEADIQNSRIESTGDLSRGFDARTGGEIRLAGSSVRMMGADSAGMFAQDDGRIMADRVAIETHGNHSVGVAAIGTGRVELVNSSLETRGNGAHGVLVQDGASVSLSSVDVSTYAADAWAAQVSGTLDIEGGSLVSAQHGAISATDHADISLRGGVQAIGGNGTLLLAGNEDAVVSLRMHGLVHAQGDIIGLDSNHDGKYEATTDVALDGASLWHGASNGAVRQLELAGDSQWSVSNDSIVGGLSLENSTIAFNEPATGDFKTVVVTGDFTSNGGTLLMNTSLGDDDSATDRLHVVGSTAGHAQVAVNNAGGTGGQSTNGIQLIRVDGDSNAHFDLAGRAVGGSYEYFLFKGSQFDPADGSWYLRSAYTGDPCDLNPSLPTCAPVGPVDPVNPVDPIDSGTPVDPTPVLRPEPGAYLANQAAAMRMFQQRHHDRGEPAFEHDRPGAWARVSRDQLHADIAGQVDARSQSNVLQVGSDVARWGHDSRGQVGVMLATGEANTQAASRITGYQTNGKVKGDAFGMYATWMQKPDESTGMYVDGWLQYGRYDSEVQGDGLAREQYDATTRTASLETGYGFALTDTDRRAVYLQPQIQVSYTKYKGDTHKEANGTVAETSSSGGLESRVGLRLFGHDNAAGNRVQPFFAANWLYNERSESMRFDGERLEATLPANRYEAQAGAQLSLGQRWSAWGDLRVQRGDSGYKDAGVQIGLRRAW